jgi:hypothetical protein
LAVLFEDSWYAPGVDLVGVISPHLEAVLSEEREEQIGGFDRVVPVPAAANCECSTAGTVLPTSPSSIGSSVPPGI